MSLIDQPYFDWLVSQIEFPRNMRKSLNGLFECMHQTEFFWTISGDDNRVQDGLDLRTDYVNNAVEFHNHIHHEFNPFVSVLEVIIAVSRMLEFTASGIASQWAWQLICNLRLNNFKDPLSRSKIAKIDDILQAFIWRTYERNGQGGLFPLLFPKEDQTKIEIWHQLNAYVREIVEET